MLNSTLCRFYLYGLVFTLLILSSCQKQSFKLFKSDSAREEYENLLEKSGLNSTKIGVEWTQKANKSTIEAAELEVPISIQGSFKSKSVEAKSWKLDLERGSTLEVQLDWNPADSSELIVDLLYGTEFEELKSFRASEEPFQLEADDSGLYYIRIQPELLGEGTFTLTINGIPTYAVFPVQGKNSASIQSFWGDDRDGGARSHEGVDIFAGRGTPVLAPVEGVVSSVKTTPRGGKQVWVRDKSRNWNLYFAHLDSQLVRNLQRVEPGDTLGLVGNTGNAISTPPHLHFGIYSRGAMNPFPVLQTEFDRSKVAETTPFSSIMKVNVDQANLRTMPSTNGDVLFKIASQTPVFIQAATTNWFQIQTLDGLIGYLSKSLLSAVDSSNFQEREAYVFTNLDSELGDSLLVNLQDFIKIGALEEFTMISDQDDNIFYLPISE